MPKASIVILIPYILIKVQLLKRFVTNVTNDIMNKKNENKK